jgi:hypothetical protein
MNEKIIQFPAKFPKPVDVSDPASAIPTADELHELFSDAVAVYELTETSDEYPVTDMSGKTVQIAPVFNMLKHFYDPMPNNLCERIGSLVRWPDRCPPTTDYSRGARLMLGLLAHKDATR